jgi:D-glucosaminate-6-phosphate ammonia-lyase
VSDDDVYRRFNVEPLINAAGKMTAFGGTAQADEVAKAQAQAARAHVDMAALRARAGELIAAHTGAQAACVTTGAAAGIAIGIAACITGNDLERVHQLPNADGLPSRVLLQAGHDIDFGAPIMQMIRVGGGRPHVVGNTQNVELGELRQALGRDEDTAAYLYVQSHHCIQHDRVSLADCIAACHDHAVPVVVDAAAEEDLVRYIAQGADLVTYSGGKAFGGPTVGFIAGRAELIQACELQGRGIARAMKVGKEQIVALLVALDRYAQRDEPGEAVRRSHIVRELENGLAELPGLAVARRADEAGRDIERIALSRTDGGDIRELVQYLTTGSPDIRTRNHHIGEGFILIDPREIDIGQARQIIARVSAFATETATRC